MSVDIQLLLMDTTSYPHAELELELLPRLHDAEQLRYRSFAHPRRRQTWLAGRALLLAALTREGGKVHAPGLRTDASGGVRYQDGAMPLSLSHCGSLIAVTLAHTRTGVDVEWLRPRAAVHQAERVFSRTEAVQLLALSGVERLEAFYALWTLKEAACKAADVPLWEALHGACFDLKEGGFSSRPPFPPGDWRFMSAGIDPNWRLAVAARGDDLRIECWRMTGQQQWHRQAFTRQVFLRGR
jgi:phosphopantetheinyl transferase